MKQISDLCKQLRLAYVNDALAQKNMPELSALVAEVLQSELDGQQRMKLNRLIHKAGFPQSKTFDGYSFETVTFPSSVSKEKLMSLSWLRQQENLLMLGAVGTGKTHLAISLGECKLFCVNGFLLLNFNSAEIIQIRSLAAPIGI